jgi:hypothetical protein
MGRGVLAAIDCHSASSLYGPPPGRRQPVAVCLAAMRGDLDGIDYILTVSANDQRQLLDDYYLTTWTKWPTDLARCTEENSEARENRIAFGPPLHPTSSCPADCSLLWTVWRLRAGSLLTWTTSSHGPPPGD